MSDKAKHLASAQKSLQKNQISKAIKDFRKVVEIDPKDIRSRQKLAELLSRDKLRDEALDQYEAVAKYYAENGFYLKAIAVYKQMQKLDPTQVKFYHRLAELNEKQGLLGNALSEYRNLVAYYEKNQMTSEAIDVLRKMKELEPENLNVLVKIAEAYAVNGMKDKARDEFDAVLESLSEKGDYAKIVKLCEMFGRFFPDDPQLQVESAAATINLGQAEKGVEQLLAMSAELQAQPAVLQALANGYDKLGRHTDEAAAFHALLEQAPGDLDLQEKYVQACLKAGEFKKALNCLEEWKDAFLDRNRMPVLKGFYEEIKENLPKNETVVKTLHAIYELSGDGDKLFDLMSDEEVAGGDTDTSLLETLDDSLLEDAVEDLEEAGEGAFAGDGEEAPVTTDRPGGEEAAGEPDEEASDESAEVSLDFLEGAVQEDEIPEDEPQLPAGTTPVDDGEGLELELELDLDLELDTDESATAAGLEEAVPAAEPEEIAPDAELEEIAPDAELEEVAPAAELEEVAPAAELEEVAPAAELEEIAPAAELEEIAPDAELEEIAPDAELEEIAPDAELEEIAPDAELEEIAPEPGFDVSFELEEAEFYFQQGLYDEASAICRKILEHDPGNQAASAKLTEISAQEGTAKVSAETTASQSPDEPESPVLLDDDADEEEFDWDAVEEEAVVEIQDDIDPEDAESHFNLGIAYKEMGLLDDAVNEFSTAMRHHSRRFDALVLKGVCLAESGDLEQAEQVLTEGLSLPGLNESEQVSLHFELGLLKEQAGDLKTALDHFLAAAKVDHFFRDVGLKIKQLKKTLGISDAGLDESLTPVKGKDKVSYL